MKSIHAERDNEIFKQVVNGQTYTAMSQQYQLSLSRPPQIVKKIVSRLLIHAKVKGIPHPFTFDKYPHAYEPSVTEDLFKQEVVGSLLQPKDLHAEKEFLLMLHNQI